MKRANKDLSALAPVLRSLDARRAEGRPVDPWLPFPQNACSFSFGEPAGPIPVGALELLWTCGAPWTQPCADCGVLARTVSFGGLLNVGGASLVCAGCGTTWFEPLGGLHRVGQLASVTLSATEFRIRGALFGGSVGSRGMQLLAELGLGPLPHEDEEGLIAIDPPLQREER